MTFVRQEPQPANDELCSLRREVETLRQRVADLQRRNARHRDGEASRLRGAVELTVSAREELLVEAERIARVGSWVWDLESDGVFWSDQLYRILGYDPAQDQATPEAFFARVHPDDRNRVQAASARGVATGVAEQIDYRILLPDGAIRYATMSGAMLFDDAQNLRRVVGTVRDLTEERRLEQQMQRSLQLLEEAQTIAQMGHWTFDLATRRVEWSAGLYRVLGVHPSTPASVALFFSRVVPEDRERLIREHEASLRGEWTEVTECRFVGPNGEIRSARIRSIASTDAMGRISEYRGTLIDVTEQAQLAQRLAQVGKTEAVARLAGGIAHDFNNLLTVIGANLELWSEAHGADDEVADARKAVRSARALTDRLLALGRRAHLARRVVAPNEVVSHTVDLLRRVVGDEVRLVCRLGSELPAIDVDPTLIEQALMNLVINARDAMLPRGGIIHLRTRSLVDELGRSWVELEVGDDGPGMTPEVKARIFEPFFTTKGERGTGLGLPTVLGTVEQHGGSIEVDSEPGHGSRFRMRLAAVPRAAVQSSAPPAAGRQGSLAQDQEVLIVEDDPLVLAVMGRILASRGYRALLAHCPSEALRVWAAHPRVELVVCDVSMAEMRGPELVGMLRQSGRKVRVLYVTGYDEKGTCDLLGDPVLTKPFKPADLLLAVSKL